MVNDQEPRYRLVDSNGNVVGSLFQNGDGNVEIQDETGTGSVFGPNGIVTPAIDAESVSAGTLVIGGTLYEEDANSPDGVAAGAGDGDFTYTVAGDYNEIIIIPDRGRTRYDGIRVNGDSGTNYRYHDRADVRTDDATQWDVTRGEFAHYYNIIEAADSGFLTLFVADSGPSSGNAVAGRNTQQSSINSFTLLNSDGDTEGFVRVYGRVNDT